MSSASKHPSLAEIRSKTLSIFHEHLQHLQPVLEPGRVMGAIPAVESNSLGTGNGTILHTLEVLASEENRPCQCVRTLEGATVSHFCESLCPSTILEVHDSSND